MANREQPDAEMGKLPVEQVVTAGMSAKGAARRRFAKGSAGASAGVILTLASQPAMATMVCTSPSGAQSGNLSKHNHEVACRGLSPGYWKTHHESWGGAYTNGNSKFRDTFTTTYRCEDLRQYTCFGIVDPQIVDNGDDPDSVAMHIMATLLNVRSGRIGFLTENQVKAIWNSYASTGTYKPAAGVTWVGWQIVAYLKSTMD